MDKAIIKQLIILLKDICEGDVIVDEENKINILSLIGSYGDTLSDPEILDMLIHFNKTGTIWTGIHCGCGN